MGALTLSGCGGSRSEAPQEHEKIRGIPLSVSGTSADYSGGLAVVIDIQGRKILGYTSGLHGPIKYAEAVALIQSEINDGDNETIELTGNYEYNKFRIRSIKANGYELEFKE